MTTTTTSKFYAFDVCAVPGLGWQPVDRTRTAIRTITERQAELIEEDYDMDANEQTWVYSDYDDALQSWNHVARFC
jgi:hypothetical protein